MLHTKTSFFSLRTGLWLIAIGSTFALPHTGAQAAPVDADPTSQLVSPTTNAVGNSAAGMIKAAKDQGSPSKGITLPVQPPALPSGTDLTTNASDLSIQAEDAAKKAQAEADQTKLRREEEHNIKSFDRAEAGLLPLSNEQIRRFMRKVEDTQEAAEAPSGGPPKGTVRMVNLQLDPGATPPQINLAANYVTTIDILDSTGAPWPILDVGIGGSFEVSPTPAGSHVVRIMPLARTGDGNLSVLLKDLPTPVIFRLSTGSASVDLRAEVRVPKFGPNAKVPLVNRPPKLQAGDETILGILQNNPPGEAKRLKISGLDARTMAWSLGEHTYVRTPLTLLSPAWSASVSSGDGMTVYEIGDAPVLLMSDNGAVVRTHISRDDDHDK